jgi:hypothetical protein
VIEGKFNVSPKLPTFEWGVDSKECSKGPGFNHC